MDCMEEQSECQAVKELNEQLKAVDEETQNQREILRAEHAEILNNLAEADALKRKEIEEINEERRKQEEIEKELMEKEKKFLDDGNTEDASEVTDELEMTRDQHKATETLLAHREEKANKKYEEVVKFCNSEIDKTKKKLQEMKQQTKAQKAEIMEKIKIAQEEDKKEKSELAAQAAKGDACSKLSRTKRVKVMVYTPGSGLAMMDRIAPNNVPTTTTADVPDENFQQGTTAPANATPGVPPPAADAASVDSTAPPDPPSSPNTATTSSHSSGDDFKLNPDAKTYDRITKIICKRRADIEKVAQPYVTGVSQLRDSEISKWIRDVRQKKTFTRTDQEIRPHTGQVYVVKMHKDKPNVKVRDMDGKSWKHNGAHIVQGKEQDFKRIAYSERDPTKDPKSRWAKNVVEYTGTPYAVVHYSRAAPLDEGVEGVSEIKTLPECKGKITDAVPSEPLGHVSRNDAKLAMIAAKESGNLNDAKATVITNPQDGEVYYFDVSDFKDWRGHVTKDNLRWHQGDGKNAPSATASKVMYYPYSVIDETNKQNTACKKKVYYAKDVGVAMVQYEGDTSIAGKFPHGNSIDNTRPHIPSSNIVKAKIRDALSEKPNAVYHEINRDGSEGLAAAITQPRDPQQVSRVQRDMKRKLSVGMDDLSSSVSVSRYLGDYVRMANVTPDHELFVLVNEDTVKEYGKVIANAGEDRVIVHHVDTSFNFNNRYVTTVSYRHELLVRRENQANQENSPTVPLFTYIHERRSAQDHEHAFYVAKQVIKNIEPSFEQAKKVLVSDREFKGKDYLPNAGHVYCWNHLEQNLKRYTEKVIKHDQDTVKTVQGDFKRMLRARDEESYYERKAAAFEEPRWTQRLKNYYDTHLDDAVVRHSGRWILEEIGVRNPADGLTNNAAESLNNTIREFRTDPRLHVSSLIVNFKVMDDDLAIDCDKAYYSSGKFAVKQEYEHLLEPITSMPMYSKESVREIMTSIRAELDAEEASQAAEDAKAEADGISVSQPKPLPEVSRLAADIIERQGVARVDFKNNPPHYAVANRDGTIANVSLANYACSCGSKNVCQHMIATQYHVGYLTSFDIPKGAKVYPPGKDTKGPKPKHGGKRPQKIDLVNEAITGTRAKKMKIPNPVQPRMGFFEPPKEDKDDPMGNAATKSDHGNIDIDMFSDGSQSQAASPIRSTSPQQRSRQQSSSSSVVSVPVTAHPTPLSPRSQAKRDFLKAEYAARGRQPKNSQAPAIPKTPNTYHTSDMLPFQTDLPEKMVRLNDGEYKIYEEKDGTRFAVKCVGGKGVVIMNDVKKKTEDHLVLAGRSVAQHATGGNRRLAGTNNDQTVTVGAVETKRSVEDAAEDSNPVLKGNAAKRYSLSCYCATPQTNSKAKDVIKCKTCKSVYHTQCAGNPEKEELKTWKCVPCKVPTKGAKWGGDLVNTCPIDNHLTLHTVIAHENKDYLRLFDTNSEGDQTFKKCIEDGLNNDFKSAQNRWATYIGVTDGDLYGSPEDMITEKLGQCREFVKVSTCTNDNCKVPAQELQMSNFSFYPHIEDPNENLDQLLQSEDLVMCQECEKDDIFAVRERGPLTQCDPDRPAAYVEFANVQREYNIDEVMDLKDKIKIGDYEYEKRMVHIRSGSKNGPGHFYSLINVEGKWLTYDGLTHEANRFKPAYPKDYARENTSVYNVVYTIADTTPKSN